MGLRGLLRTFQPNRLGCKTHVIVDVQCASLVVGKKLVVALAKNSRIGPADVGGEDAP